MRLCSGTPSSPHAALKGPHPLPSPAPCTPALRRPHEKADVYVNGLIDYEEFVTATVHMKKMDREEHLYTTF
ncbi:hypothetical protein ZWY2020_012645 [Hordeum vulgare]|nr:hypothetical protein ZWY2020_012645 [Hordeum vulgare]